MSPILPGATFRLSTHGRAVCLVLLFIGGIRSPALGAEWIEVQSPHFRVVTEEGERDARRVALELERVHAMFTQALAGSVRDPLRPVVVFLVKGGTELGELVPKYADGPQPGGLFHQGPFVHHLVVRRDAGPQTIYHEYFHLLSRRDVRRLPVWLVEGLAEFHGNADLTSSTAKFGVPDAASLEFLNRRSEFPLDDLLRRSSNPHEDGDRFEIRTFYSLAWVLTHFLMVGADDPTEQRAVSRYIDRVQRGADSVDAFTETVGDVDAIAERLRNYVRRFQFRELRMELEARLDDETFAVRTLSDVESLALRASVSIWGADPEGERAEALLDEALAVEEESAVVHEVNGVLYLSRGNQPAASLAFERATHLGSTNYAAYYMYAMSIAEDQTDAGRAARLERLHAATSLNPRFAPAYLEIARLHANAGNFTEAAGIAQQAVNLDPTVIPGWVLLGQIYMAMNDVEVARGVVQRGMSWAIDSDERAQLVQLSERIDAHASEATR